MSDTPLNIFIADPHLAGGGQVRYVANLAREFTRLGHRVTIGCKPRSVLVDCAAAAGCSALDRFAWRGGLRPRTWMNDIRLVQRLIREDSPDVIHVNGSQDHWTCALANQFLRRPVCLVRTRHNTYRVADHLPNRILNRSWTDFEIVVCDVVRQTLARQAAFDAARMCSIHNGVDAGQFRPDPEARRRARAEFGYGDGHVVFGIAARLVDAKGHRFLFEAASRLRQNQPGMRILVLGQGNLEAALKRLAHELEIAPIVQWAGFRNDMAQCLQAIDIGVQPSIDCDTSSFSLKEMMALEIPVIASDYGGLTEIVADGEEGRVVAAGTVEPLAQAMAALLADAPKRREMGIAGRRRVLRDFTIEVCAQRTLDAYRRALEIHRTGKGLPA